MAANFVCFFDPLSSSNKGKISGTVEFHSCGSEYETFVRFKLSGFPPNKISGCHIHECGDLTKGCASACAHYNPENKLHGSQKLFGSDRHAGDLCSNIIADENGEVDFVYWDELIELRGPNSIAGRAVVIHQGYDDMGAYRYQDTIRGKESAKTGNAGERIACAIIGITDSDFHPTNDEIREAEKYRAWLEADKNK